MVVKSAILPVILPVILSAKVMTGNVKTVINVSLVIYPAITVMIATELVTKPVSQDMAVVLLVRAVVLPATVVFHLPAILVIPPVRQRQTVVVAMLGAIFVKSHRTVQLIVILTV